MPTIDEVVAQATTKTEERSIQLDFIDNALTVLSNFNQGKGSFYDDYVVNALYTNLFDKLQDDEIDTNIVSIKTPRYFTTFYPSVNESNYNDIIIIVSGRTDKWVKGSDDIASINFWGETQFPQNLSDRTILNKFSNGAYFEPLYSNNEQIYVFRLITNEQEVLE